MDLVCAATDWDETVLRMMRKHSLKGLPILNSNK